MIPIVCIFSNVCLPNPVSLSDYTFFVCYQERTYKNNWQSQQETELSNAIVITTMMMMVKPTPIFFQMKSSHKPRFTVAAAELCIFHRKLMLLMTCHCQHVSTTTWDFFDHENKSPKDSKIQTKMHRNANEYANPCPISKAIIEKEQKMGKIKWSSCSCDFFSLFQVWQKMCM